MPAGSTIAARWVTFGVVKAPRKSTETSRSALPVAMAYRKTMPQVLRSRRAVSYRPRASTLRRTESSSGAVILSIAAITDRRVGKIQ